MITLGINAAFHDSSAAIVVDGRVIAAAEEERFTRIKHAKRPVPFSAYELPYHAIDYCLEAAEVALRNVDHVAYAYNPFIKLGQRRADAAITLPLEPSAHPVPEEWEAAWDPLFLASIVNAPRQLKDGVPHHLQDRFRGIGVGEPFRWHFVDHHMAHAVSAFLPAPFDHAAVLTLDGRGERATTLFAQGEGRRMHWIDEIRMPHSLGVFYEALTGYLGFLHSSDEYKVMALASFGKPRYMRELREMLRLEPGGRFRVLDYDFEKRFGPARRRGGPLREHHFDIASSAQLALEETVLEMVRWLQRTTGERNLCLAGGVALNCVMNGRLLREGPFDAVWVQPAAGDAGTALGAALWIDALFGSAPRWTMRNAYLGPGYDDAAIEDFLDWARVPYERAEDVAGETAALLAENKLVGWYQGRMEFGPRALGARSILASPLDAAMQQRLNDLKGREEFRPVAPAVLAEEAEAWFEDARPSPFMLFVFKVRPEKAARIPAVMHVDGTARIQTVAREGNPRYYDMIRAFGRRTGVPIVINTSFNTRSEPIVCTPRDALEAFWSSPLDALVMGSCVISKKPGGRLDADFSRHSDIQTAGIASPLPAGAGAANP